MPSRLKQLDVQGDSVRNLRGGLLALIRASNLSFRELDRRTGLRRGCSTGIFAGKIELSVRHVFIILAALAVKPADFFDALYPSRRPRPDRPKQAPIKMIMDRYDLVGHPGPEEMEAIPPLPAGINTKELGRLIEAKLAEAVNYALSDLAKRRAFEAAERVAVEVVEAEEEVGVEAQGAEGEQKQLEEPPAEEARDGALLATAK